MLLHCNAGPEKINQRIFDCGKTVCNPWFIFFVLVIVYIFLSLILIIMLFAYRIPQFRIFQKILPRISCPKGYISGYRYQWCLKKNLLSTVIWAWSDFVVSSHKRENEFQLPKNQMSSGEIGCMLQNCSGLIELQCILL